MAHGAAATREQIKLLASGVKSLRCGSRWYCGERIDPSLKGTALGGAETGGLPCVNLRLTPSDTPTRPSIASCRAWGRPAGNERVRAALDRGFAGNSPTRRTVPFQTVKRVDIGRLWGDSRPRNH